MAMSILQGVSGFSTFFQICFNNVEDKSWESGHHGNNYYLKQLNNICISYCCLILLLNFLGPKMMA